MRSNEPQTEKRAAHRIPSELQDPLPIISPLSSAIDAEANSATPVQPIGLLVLLKLPSGIRCNRPSSVVRFYLFTSCLVVSETIIFHPVRHGVNNAKAIASKGALSKVSIDGIRLPANDDGVQGESQNRPW